MRTVRPLALLLTLVGIAAAQEKPLTRIAFASCADQERPLPIFDRIVALKPELYIAMGDNVYADVKPEPGLEPMASLAKKYEKMAALEGWQNIRKQCPVVATWDDHDYGKNDVGAEFPFKDESQKLFLDFFQVPADSPRRTRKGVYDAPVFGPEGQRVQVILLDTRYHRSKLAQSDRKDPSIRAFPYVPTKEANATFLGAEQWAWLEEQLKKPAEVRLLVSSLQVVSDEHPHEKWANIPAEREKLYALIKSTKARGVVVLSGDRHLAEMSVDPRALSYPLFDVTSSGLNQGFKGWRAPEPNRHRVGAMSHGDNFGFIAIDWSGESPRLSLQIRDVDGEITVKDTVPLKVLQPRASSTAALPHMPGEGAVSPRDAVTMKVGEKVVVEMAVQSAATASTRVLLNSEKDFRDEQNFTVVLNAKAKTGKWENATAATFKGKVIRVTGAISAFKGSPQIEVNDEKQLEVIPPAKE